MSRVQYSLGSLFELTLACAAFSASLAVWLHKGCPVDPRLMWIIAWLILCTIYRRQRARAVMRINGLAAVVGGPCLIVVCLFGGSGEAFGLTVPEEATPMFITAVGFACLAGTAVSFPVFVLWFLFGRRPAARAGRE